MFKLGILLFLCAAAAGETCNETPSCSLFPNQDRGVVTLQDLTQKVQSKHWIMIYYTEFSDKQASGKCHFRWNAPDNKQNIKRELMCYKFDTKRCTDYAHTVKRKAADCNRGEENSAMQETLDAKFYSQDVDKYFWYDSCYEYDNENKCKARYLDLLVSKSRYQGSDDGELNLQGLPWQLIASDLKYHFNMDMSDNRVKFSWKGPNCGFDGTMIETSSASQRSVNNVAWFVFLGIYALIY